MNGKITKAAAFLCAFIILFASACKEEEMPPFFALNSVDTPAAVASDEKVNRYNADYTDSFTPSTEYGKLIPFVGDVLIYKSADAENTETVTKPVYGLCTASGAVVVDPVYDNVFVHSLNGITLYEILIGSDSRDLAEKRLLIPDDGSWLTELSKEQRVSEISGNGLFAIECDRQIKQKKKKVIVTFYEFYTFGGEFSFEFDKNLTKAADTKFVLGSYFDELLDVNVTITTETVEKDEDGKDVKVVTEEKYGYYVDLSGKPAFEEKEFEFFKVEPFYNGLAVVVTKDGKYGVLKSDGEYFLEPQFNVINRNSFEGYFACGTDGYFSIIKNDGAEVTKIYCENADIDVLGTEKLIYKKTLKYSGKTEFFTINPEGAFICKETGRFPDANAGKQGIFTCSYSGVTDIFGTDGKSFAQFTDFGKLCGVFGNSIVVEGKSSGVWVVDRQSGHKSERIEGKFVAAHGDGNYIVVKNGDKYSVYSLGEKALTVNNADGAYALGGILSVVADGYVTLYGTKYQVLSRCFSQTEVLR